MPRALSALITDQHVEGHDTTTGSVAGAIGGQRRLIGGRWVLAGWILVAFGAAFLTGVIVAVGYWASRPGIYARIDR